MDEIVFDCPECGATINLPAMAAGRTGGCPNCNTQVTAPLGTTVDKQPPQNKTGYVLNRSSRVIEVTTKNTASLSLGISSLALGTVCCLFSWVPFIGLVAVPIACMGVIIAFFGGCLALVNGFKGFGMPLAGFLVCSLAVAVSVGSTEMSINATSELSRELEPFGSESPFRDAVTPSLPDSDSAPTLIESSRDGDEKEKQYIMNSLRVYDVDVRYRKSLLDGELPGFTCKIENKGNRTLTYLEVVVYFKNAIGRTIHEESFTLLWTGARIDPDSPLKPGYIWQNEKGTFLKAKSVPDEWLEGRCNVEVIDIEFE